MLYFQRWRQQAMITVEILLSFIVSVLASTVYYLIETTRNGMAKKRWLTAGFILGPIALPMFQISKKLALRKVAGYNSVYLKA